ncbi:MAG: hypothetical protein WBL91_28980, partial [Pseudolabrys sp.]
MPSYSNMWMSGIKPGIGEACGRIAAYWQRLHNKNVFGGTTMTVAEANAAGSVAGVPVGAVP